MRFKKGSNVEVLSKKEVPSGSWRCAEIISGDGHNYTVRYDGYEGAKKVTLVERVSGKAVRPCPPPLEISENWVRGDVVEVFDNCSWKMATVSQVLRKNFFLVRLLGSSLEFEVFKFDIRARQSWQGDKWVVVGKGSVNFDHGKYDENLALTCNRNLSYRYHKTNTRVNLKAEDDRFLVKNRVNILESHVVSSKSLKRGSPYCYSHVEVYAGVNQKFRAIEKEDTCLRVKAANSSTLPEKVDVVAFQGDMLGEKYKNASSNNRTTGLSEVEVERRRPTGTVGCSLANLESNYADSVTCSVGSCSITSNSSYKIPHVSAGHIKDDGGNSSDAESFCQWAYEEGNSLPTKEELADEIHRLELHAYRCTIEALHASGPLSWEREELVTNLRLSLHISNDEHLMELRNLGSTHTSIPIR